MNIEIREINDPKIDDIMNLYLDAGWANYTQKPSMLIDSYKNSLKILGAYDLDMLVGIIRVVGDGYSIIYIQDLIVLKAYQRQGIGKRLLQDIMNQYSQVYQKILLTDNKPETRLFYESL